MPPARRAGTPAPNDGLAVLRAEEVRKLLKDRRLRQGSATWPAHNGVDRGPFVDWWSAALVNLEGEDHTRIRRLLQPGLRAALDRPPRPALCALAEELIAGFARAGRCEFMSEFAEPYAGRVIAIILGIPEREWRSIAAWSADLGLGLTVDVAAELDRVEGALEGLYGYADELIAERTPSPGDDFVSVLVEAHHGDDRLSADELRVALVLLMFGGLDRPPETNSGSRSRPSSTIPISGGCSPSAPSSAARRSRR